MIESYAREDSSVVLLRDLELAELDIRDAGRPVAECVGHEALYGV